MIGYVSIGLLGLLALSIPVGIVLFLLALALIPSFRVSRSPRDWGIWSGPLLILRR